MFGASKYIIQIRRSLQYMTDWGLSSLYSMNNFQIIKTDNISNNKKQIETYVNRFCENEFDAERIVTGNNYSMMLVNIIKEVDNVIF